MTKQDMQAMFATNKVKVNSLDNSEMAKTEGEFWGFVIRVIIGIIAGMTSAR